MTPLLSASDVASMAQVKPVTVRRWAKGELLPCIRIRGRLRFDPADVQSFLMRHRVSC